MLNNALAEGRLTVAEHSDRLDSVYQAKTHAEIVPLIEDLPARAPGAAPARRTDVAPATGRSQKIIAIFGGATRKGRWHAGQRITVLTIFGGAQIDFRDADLAARDITLNATSIFGGMEIIVPPEMQAVDSGVAVFGGRDTGHGKEDRSTTGGPILRLTGLTLFGGLSLNHKQRKNRNQDR